MTGESKVMNMNDSTIQLVPSLRNIQGVLYMTNYRIVFIPSPQDFKMISTSNPSILSWLQVPLGCIDKVERSKDSQPLNGICILLSCKDCRQLKVTIRKSYSASGDYEVERAYNLIYTYVFPNNLKHIFAFNHKLPSTNIPVDLLAEYSRLGILDSNYWRITTANNDFKLCNTYSETLIVPRSVSDEELFAVAAFRSGCRLPALSWGDANNGATLWRSAQPKCGMSGSCKQDERLLDVIAQSAVYFQRKNHNGNRREPILYIVDCRSRASAMANRAAGAGYESQTNYVSSRLEFYNIPNIHAVRESLRGVTSVVLNPSANPGTDLNFSKQIEDSQWLTNARLIIKASHETAAQLHRGIPVLVHCSHGWDRTAQVCTISQLFLDPFYRTMDGFAVLIEKEWCSFGHPFFMRCGHGHEKGQRSEDDISPIFLQCVDCIWQIVKQFPSYFEFNTRYLLTLADHIYSCRFGTFLFSSDQQRVSIFSFHTFPEIANYLFLEITYG
jgi:myotubularin-related protein 1/2